MYIEIIKVFEIFGIIADIKLIHATYLIFCDYCQIGVPKNAALRKQKGQIHKLGFTLLSLDIIQISKMDFKRISAKSCWYFVAALSLKKRISQIFGSFEKL